MAYKIGTLTVQVQPGDESFEDQLRAQVKAATDKVDATVGLRLNDDAVIFLNEDVHAALDLAVEGATAKVGMGLRDDAVAELDADVQAGIDLVEERAKVKVSVDPKSAEQAQDGLSGLIVAALAGGAAIGAPALVAGVDAAFTAITALALKNNAVIKADYVDIGTTAKAALQEAVAPLAPDLHQAVGEIQDEITKLQPTIDGLFSNAGPDITAFTDGVGNLASGVLPGLSKALGNSHDLVSDVSTGLGQLGRGAGDFLTGLTRDESTTGQGLQAVIGTAGNALGTLGNIAGSASSAISADLLAITPAVNGALTAINKLSSPETVGAAAGAFAVFKLGGSLQSGLQSASDKVLDIAARADGAGGMLGKMSGAAEGASGGLSKMADIAGGPWGIAIGAGIGLLSGLAGELINAGEATKAVTVDSQKLIDAIGQDGGAAGQATAAYITATDAANGLSQSAQAAGVSQATWTEAVLGNKDAQDQIITSIKALNQAQRDQALAAAEQSGANSHAAQDLKGANVAAAQAAAANNTLTDANQKTINSLQAQTRQIADAISAQTKYQQAMAAVTSQQQLFNASLDAAYEQLVANSQASALTTVGSLNLGDANYTVTSSLNSLVTGYDEAQTEGSAYAHVLAAINGQTQTLIASEAAFTTALSGVTAAAKANGHSLDVNTAKGAANITAFSGIATAADKAAEAVYNSEVNTRGATGAYNDANAKLAQEKQAFEDAAIKAGYNKDQVKALADQLFQLPKDVKIGVDTSAADKGLKALIAKIDGSYATVGVYETPDGYVHSKKTKVAANAVGGRGYAGVPQIVGDAGRPEMFVPDSDGYTYPSVTAGAKAVAEHNARVAGPGAGAVTVNQYFSGQLPSTEKAAQMSHALAGFLGAL